MNAMVRDVMTTEVVAVRRDTSFKEIAAALRRHRVSAFPVIDEDGKVIGVVSEADLLAKEALRDPGVVTEMLHHKDVRKAEGLTAGDLMTHPAVTIEPEDSVGHAARLMYSLRVKRLPVVNAGGGLVGLVSRTDVLAVYDRPDEKIREEITSHLILHECLEDPRQFTVSVRNGVVTLQGSPETAALGREIVRRVRHVQGVVAVRDRLSYPADDFPVAAGPLFLPGAPTGDTIGMSQQTTPVYALLADGTTVEIRPVRPGDYDAVKAMHEAMPPDNLYLRFFNVSRLAAETEARRLCRDPEPGSAALLALANGEVAGVASYAAVGNQTAEVAFAVADHMHHRGIATLLLEHLVSYARSHQVSTFTAQTLTENKAMLNVFADAGLPVQRRYADGVLELTFPLPRQDLDSYLDVVAERERRAEVASLRHIFAPESVAVIGASRRSGTVGRAILDKIRAGGYAGRLHVVNPRARQIGGEHCLASPLDLPEGVDLAVVAVPAAAVLDVAERCGQRGVRALVVITAGLGDDARADLLAVCRRHGMRLVGPDSFGVAVPGLGLDATFAARPAVPGVAGLVLQSGGLGLAVVDHLSRLGIGISSFASVGDKLDVSGNDMLLWWERDGLTRLAVLYIESFGNPRKFARTARRVSCLMPVLTVLADRSDAVSRQALFGQAGVITTNGFGDLVEATALLASQPVPAGRTVAIVSNVGSAGVLAADACAELGLAVHHPAGLTRRRLRALVPGGTVAGPVDTTGPVSAEAYRRCLELLAAEEDVHAIVAIMLPTGATGDLEAVVGAAEVGLPVAAVVLNQAESVRFLGPGGRVPAYGSPEAAVRALARAAGYGAWLAAPRGQVPALADVRTVEARALVRGHGRLGPAQTAELLRCYGIPLADLAPAGTGVRVRVADDHVFGPLVTLQAGDSYRTARFTPLTDVDAAQLTGPGAPADLDVLRDLLLRVSRLAEDLPEVTELDLDPVVAGPDGAAVVGARVVVAPYQPQDPFLRKLR